MKAITLTQPWASLVMSGAKLIETRSWSTQHRGLIAIHAAKGFPSYARTFATSRLVLLGLGRDPARAWPQLPTGVVLGTCNLNRVLPIEAQEVLLMLERRAGERALGDYSRNRYAWILSNPAPFAAPIEARGALGLWEWEGP